MVPRVFLGVHGFATAQLPGFTSSILIAYSIHRTVLSMKHGIEQHLVRPDRVYATGVWTPTVGYQPTRDAMEVAARFVADRGLAGVGLGSFSGWWQTLVARIRTRIAAARLRRRMALPAGAVVATELDSANAPRGPATTPTALAVQGGWAPAPMSAAGMSARLRDLVGARSGAPELNAEQAAMQIAPAGAGAPATFWRDVMHRGFPPVVAARAQNDALRRFYANRLPGAGY